MRAIEIDSNNERDVQRYDALFESCPNAFIQQSSYWCEAIRGIGPDVPLFLVCSDGKRDVAGLPLYLFEAKPGNILTSIPQAGPLGGIFHLDGLSELEIGEAYGVIIEKALGLAEKHRCIALSMTTSPISDDVFLYETALSPTYILHNFTQVIYLRKLFRHMDAHSSASEKQPLGQEQLLSIIHDVGILDSAKRNNLTRNIKKSIGTELRVVSDAPLSRVHEWYLIHAKRHREIGIDPLDARLLEGITGALSRKGRCRLTLIEVANRAIAGMLVVFHRNVADAFMLSYDSAFRKLAPNYPLTASCLIRAFQDGISIFNWQSSTSRSSGVYCFKRQWGSVDKTYSFVTKLFCDRERICRLGIDGIRGCYPGHYVVPFGIFREGPDKRLFIKGEN